MQMRRERIATGAPDAGAKPSTLTQAADAAESAEAGAANERPEPQGGGVEAALAPLRVLLERGDEQGARRLVGELLKQWPDSPRLQHLSRILAPPPFALGPT
jgi:hypothetical protein